MFVLLLISWHLNTSFASPIFPLMEDAHRLIGEARALQPGFTDRIEALSLEWGEHLYLALHLLRLGQTELAAEAKESLLETLGELNLRVQSIPDEAGRVAVATNAIADVGELMRDKFGTLGPDERAIMVKYLEELVRAISTRATLIAAGRAAVAPELATRRKQRNLRVWGNVGATLGALGACAATLLVPAPWPVVHVTQYLTAGGSIYAAIKFYVVTTDLGRQDVAEPAETDPNYVLAPVSRVLEFFTAPTHAAIPYGASRAG